MFGRLIFDLDIEEFIYGNTCDKIVMVLVSGNSTTINEIGNYIKREELDIVSYLPKSKISNLSSTDDPYSDGIGRVSIRIGRFVNKFIKNIAFSNYNISPKDLESFVNLYKSYFFRSESSLKLVQGNEILKWYCEDSYYQHEGNRFGPLWNSCMRQSERNKFMNLYVDNDIKMLILLSDDGRLLGRAIIWEKALGLDGSEYKVMDRIYTMYDHDVNMFKNWAKQNGFYHKIEQSAKSEKYFTKYNGDGVSENAEILMSVTMTNHKQRYYPYLDTFKFYDPKNGQFSNSDFYNHEYILVQSNGGLLPPEPEPEPEPEFYDDDENYDPEW